MALPPDVFDVSGDFRMTINLSNFMSNDDSTFYNIFAEDDGSSKIHGAIKPANAVVEMVGYFIIPSGFTATACRIDITDDKGAAITRDLTFESFTTYGGTLLVFFNYFYLIFQFVYTFIYIKVR